MASMQARHASRLCCNLEQSHQTGCITRLACSPVQLRRVRFATTILQPRLRLTAGSAPCQQLHGHMRNQRHVSAVGDAFKQQAPAGPDERLPQLLSRFSQHALSMTDDQLCRLLYGLAGEQAKAAPKERQQHEQQLRQVVQLAAHQLHQRLLAFNGEQLSMCMWALAKLKDYGGYGDRELWATFCAHAQGPNMQGTPVRWWSNLLWALARMDVADTEQLFAYAADVALPPLLGKANPQDINNTLWAYATLGHVDNGRRLATTVMPLVVQQDAMRGAKPQHWSNMLWASARMDVADTEQLFAYAADVALPPLLGKANPQDINNTLWAYATLGHVDSGRRLAATVMPKVVQQDAMRGATPQQWSNLLWALARMDVADTVQLFAYAADVALPPLLGKANPQDINNTLWAYATLGHVDSGRRLATTVMPKVVQQDAMRGATLQQWSNLLWALARMDVANTEQLFAYAADVALLPLLAKASPRDINNTLWAYTTLGHVDSGRRLAAAVKPLVAQRGVMRGVEEQAWSKLLWA